MLEEKVGKRRSCKEERMLEEKVGKRRRCKKKGC